LAKGKIEQVLERIVSSLAL